MQAPRRHLIAIVALTAGVRVIYDAQAAGALYLSATVGVLLTIYLVTKFWNTRYTIESTLAVSHREPDPAVNPFITCTVPLSWGSDSSSRYW